MVLTASGRRVWGLGVDGILWLPLPQSAGRGGRGTGWYIDLEANQSWPLINLNDYISEFAGDKSPSAF